jgi:uncharacterized protein YegL
MIRLLGAIGATAVLVYTSLLSAQTVTSGNISATVTAPNSIQCSSPLSSSLSLTGFDVQNPGFADIMLVLDESGSISDADFNREKTFAVDLINNVMTTPGGARVGIVQFSSNARLTMPLTTNRQNAINQANAMNQRDGSTCIGCGIDLARQHFQQQPRPQATKFMIVLTDGANNVNVSTFQPIVNAAKNAGIKLLAIGIGNAVLSEIEFIASDIPGVQTSFFINDFSALPDILNQLTAAISSPGSTNVSVTLDVMPRFPVSAGTASAGSVSVTGSTVVWTLPALGASPQTLTLSHQHDGQGNGPLQVFTGTYTDTQGHVVEIPTPSTTVNGCNTAPVANAGLDQSVDLTSGNTATVTLNGTGSTDDGLIQPLSYTWSGAAAATGATPTVTLPFGVHTFVLTVSDGELTDTDTVTVTVNDPTPPVIARSVTGTQVNGWYTSNVEISFTAVDPQSGIASSSGCGAVTLATDTAGQTFTCTATNGAGASSTDSVTVRRDTTAPQIGAVSPSVSSLWPANHRMMGVTVNAAATDGMSAASCSITSVTSSEPDNGLGDGDTANDIVITGPLSVDLRAERSGNGPGRIYTINVVCTDAAGNTASSSTTVSVPKSNGK